MPRTTTAEFELDGDGIRDRGGADVVADHHRQRARLACMCAGQRLGLRSVRDRLLDQPGPGCSGRPAPRPRWAAPAAAPCGGRPLDPARAAAPSRRYPAAQATGPQAHSGAAGGDTFGAQVEPNASFSAPTAEAGPSGPSR